MTETVRIKTRWVKFLRFVMGLGYGRYLLTVSIWPSGMDWSVVDSGKIHLERDEVSD